MFILTKLAKRGLKNSTLFKKEECVVFLKFKEALKKSKEIEKVKNLDLNKDYLLTAAVSILKAGASFPHEWILIYYNERINKTVQVVVNEKSVEVKEEQEPLKPSVLKLDIKSIKTNSDKMLDKARGIFKNFHVPLSQIIINLIQMNSSPVWKFSFITKTLEVIAIELNAFNGEVVGTTRKKLVK